MKRAIAYIRISDKDQSNFSTPGQDRTIREFCERENIRITCDPFIDDGKSAKNFDRPDWKKLEDYVRKHHKDIDYLIVMKYDRFSRNVAEALNMIDKLEKKYKIFILSVMEKMFVEPSNPFYFKMRADMLVQAEFELRVIRDRTNFGINQAKKEGRWINRAPFGYINERDEEDKPVLKIHPENAELVKKAFQLHNEGVKPFDILRQIKQFGKVPGGRSFISRLLQNPAYAGMIKHGDQILPGKHEPIVDLLTYQISNNKFKKEADIRYIINDDVPLRGVLHCECGKLLTAGKSKGKTKYYWYYKCLSHLDINLSAVKIHNQLGELLMELSLTSEQIDKIKKDVETRIKESVKALVVSQSGVKTKIETLLRKLESVEEKFILNQISFDSYSRWRETYDKELETLKQQQNPGREINIWKQYEKQTAKLTQLNETYKGLTTLQKQRFVNTVFNYSLSYELNSFSATAVIPPFSQQTSALKEKGLLRLATLSDQSLIRTPKEPLIELFEVLSA